MFEKSCRTFKSRWAFLSCMTCYSETFLASCCIVIELLGVIHSKLLVACLVAVHVPVMGAKYWKRICQHKNRAS